MESTLPIRPKSSYLRRGVRSASPPKASASPPKGNHLARRLSATHTSLVSKDLARRLSQGMIKAPGITPEGGHSSSSAAWRAREQGFSACVPRRPPSLSKCPRIGSTCSLLAAFHSSPRLHSPGRLSRLWPSLYLGERPWSHTQTHTAYEGATRSIRDNAKVADFVAFCSQASKPCEEGEIKPGSTAL